ncbi:tail protein [Vibrio phage vB_VspP_pVa5]|uniref:Hydrolase protein n=1 Tax=Vibrio phage vB_VspP_pVa5 TaxID=1913109 RepID=A0A286M2S8_9CAUD|nr:tail protein [Vibrio phage vB_VspP_pVa5]ASV62327.1 hydrolase protein [Vibrio phage vB_VspP_pVa5]
MGVNRYKGTCTSNAALVNKYIGTAYDHVKNVSDNIEDVKTVADALGEDFPDNGLDILVENIDDVVTVATNIDDVITVAGISADVTTVAGIEQEIIDVPSYTAQAIDAANAAEQDATEAEASNLKAQKWAEENEDVEVDPGKYSSKHWATKAEEVVLDAATETWVESGAPEIIATGSTTPRRLDDRFADEVNVKDFGAVGDGITDDTAAIQAAVDLASNVKGAVIFPHGIYLLDTMTDDYYVNLKPNVSIHILDGAKVIAGTGYNIGTSKLKAIFNQVDSGTSLGNISVKGEFDFNGTNNLVTDVTGTKNAAVSVLRAESVVINIKATNHAGRQVVQLGDTANTIKTVIIERLECENVGAGLAGNVNQTDHSSIYAVCDDLIVKSMSVKNDIEPTQTVTALETHSVRTSVSNLHTSNVGISVIVAAVEQNIESFVMDNCVLRGDQMLNTWTFPAMTLDHLHVGDSNTFTKTFGTLSVVDLSTNMQGSGDNVRIGAMSFNNTKLTYDAVTPVILLGRWRTTSVGECVVARCDARFIQTGNIFDNNSSLYVSGSITEHTNQNAAPGFNQLVRLSGANAFATVIIQGMKATPKSGSSSATVGISVECPVNTKMDIVDNAFNGTISTDIFDNSSPSPSSNFYVRHRGDLVPAAGLKAKAGSEVFLETSGNLYRLEANGSDWKLFPLVPRTSVGNPIGAILPNHVGEELLGGGGTTWYKSTGLTNNDWVALN